MADGARNWAALHITLTLLVVEAGVVGIGHWAVIDPVVHCLDPAQRGFDVKHQVAPRWAA